MTRQVTYKDAGVDLGIYANSMSRLPKLAAKTFSPRVMRLDGGFAGLFQLQGEGKKYDDPVLVSCTDGVGTKLKVACAANRHDSIGIDLVAMSVNDAICCGAEPLFFLDYVAMSKDDPDLLETIVQGISDGCVQSDIALLGGETAIMPDVYSPGEYDLAGFCVGVADRKKIIDGKAITKGDRLLGVASSGFHSNGYSLVRKIVFEMAGLSGETMVPELGGTIFDILLEPTYIYAKPIMELLRRYGANDGIRGIAHITGGGLEENLGRILPKGTKPMIFQDSWSIPPLFTWLEKLGNVAPEEMRRVFNMGLGLVLVLKPEILNLVQQDLDTMAIQSYDIGAIG